jgi:hypothetical protein
MGRSMNTSAASAPGLKIQALEKFDGWRSWKLSGQMPIADRAFLALRQDHPVPRTYSSMTRSEPNSHGSMNRLIRTSAGAGVCDAANRNTTPSRNVPALPHEHSGASGANTTARFALGTNLSAQTCAVIDATIGSPFNLRASLG